jgi:2-dehydropantoate 2-reductase
MARIVFIGAGGVGTYLGGWLAHLGHDVTLIEHWAGQVETIAARGLEVSGPHETFVARPRIVHLHESERIAREPFFEIGFVAVKAYDTQWAATFVDRFVHPNGFIVSAQNCWPDPDIAAAVGGARSVGLVMSNISVEMFEAGKVNRPGAKRQRDIGHDVFRAGEHDGSDTERLHGLIAMLDPIDAGKVTTNLWGERWAKLSQNAMHNPVSGASGMGLAELAADPACRALHIELAKEAATVGLALGHRVEDFGGKPASVWATADDPATYEEIDGMIARRSQGPNRRPSMAQDVIKGRASEIRCMNGFIVDKARELGIQTPANAAIVAAMLAVDAGELKPSRQTIDLVLARAGIAVPAGI